MTNNMQPRDRLIPWYFVAFFVVLALIDGVMVTIAIKTQPGIVAKHPYEQGLAYNKVVKASEEQDMLGWNGDINFKFGAKNSGHLIFILRDKSGVLLNSDSAYAYISRPTQASLDFNIPLNKVKPGTFEADINFPANGLWEVRVYAKKGTQNYQQSKRVVLE